MHRQITSKNFNASEVVVMYKEGGDDIDGIPITVVFDYGKMLN
jgi:orotate phosphoribosyltransferase-like protein